MRIIAWLVLVLVVLLAPVGTTVAMGVIEGWDDAGVLAIMWVGITTLMLIMGAVMNWAMNRL